MVFDRQFYEFKSITKAKKIKNLCSNSKRSTENHDYKMLPSF